MMRLDEARVRRAEAIFLAVVAMPPEGRSAAIREQCGSDPELRGLVEELVACDAADGDDFDRRIRFRPRVFCDNEPFAPFRLGQYRVTRRVGEGGMGVVYEAEQEHPRRTIALKLLRPGLFSPRIARRFEHEAEVLARLEHPGIAQVYAAGTADAVAAGGVSVSQPFLAMELVRGEALLDFAARRGLDVPQRMELIARVCDAVEHAHQKGVIHRDLKPANILVTESGQPKVLDFGVARMTNADTAAVTTHTQAGQLIGTIPYMSPEQLAGDTASVDTRSDVYSLGVVAFELLAGRLPFDIADRPPPQAIRILTECDAMRAGAVRRALRGDVEAILAQALQKQPEHRYGSVAALADDIRRYLRHEPVRARSPGALYLLGKFARRNRGLVVGASLALAALVTGTIGTATFAWRESEQAERAEINQTRALADAAKADAVVRLLLDVVRSPDPSLVRGPKYTVRELLDEISAQVSERFSNQPEIEAAVRATVGRTYQAIGLYEKARPHLQTALETRARLFGECHADVAESQNDLAELLHELSEFEAARPLYERALATRERLLGREHPLVADVLLNLGILRHDEEDVLEAERLCRRALQIYQAADDGKSSHIGACLDRLGYLARAGRRFDEAEEHFRAAIAFSRRRFGDRHPSVFMSTKSLAALLRVTNRLEEAEALYAEALAGSRELLGPDHPNVANILNSLAILRYLQQRFDESDALFVEALDIYRKAYAGDDLSIAICLLNYARMFSAKGEPVRAAELAREALEMRRRLHPESHPGVTQCLQHAARFLAAAGDESAAIELQRDAIQRVRGLPADQRWVLAARLRDLGEFMIAHVGGPEERPARLCEAEAALLEAYEIDFNLFGETRWRTRRDAAALASLYEARDQAELAARWRATSSGGSRPGSPSSGDESAPQ